MHCCQTAIPAHPHPSLGKWNWLEFRSADLPHNILTSPKKLFFPLQDTPWTTPCIIQFHLDTPCKLWRANMFSNSHLKKVFPWQMSRLQQEVKHSNRKANFKYIYIHKTNPNPSGPARKLLHLKY